MPPLICVRIKAKRNLTSGTPVDYVGIYYQSPHIFRFIVLYCDRLILILTNVD